MAVASTSNLSELASFRSDDAVIEMIPQFALQQPLVLHTSAKPVGPWQAGIPTKVPLWLACHLQTKRLCTVPTPAWLTVSNLSEILAFERKESSLWRDESRLPFEYYQIAQRMSLDPAAQLLIKDLLQVRMDKLRQQFQDLLKNQPVQLDEENLPPPLVVEITGMGSVEIALLQKTVQQALKDQATLRYSAMKKTATKDTAESGTPMRQAEEEPTPADRPSSQRRVALRKFR
uniref:DNA replication complex GINS protein PSF2 n=1 Tax=Amphora coffeiformis TaxID=265554 RepID=A0A7S3L587_9STRA|eukprot:scaffold5_cov169-Amphora_coffeaeformis.AAC.36